jgi:hypothetical protein
MQGYQDRSTIPLAIHFPTLQNSAVPHQPQPPAPAPAHYQPVFFQVAPGNGDVAQPLIVTNLPALSFATTNPCVNQHTLNAVHTAPHQLFVTPMMTLPLQVATPAPAIAQPPQVPIQAHVPIVQGIVATVPSSEGSPLKNASSASAGTSISGSRRKRRQRSAFIHELTYKGRYHPDTTNCLSRIRIWINSSGLQYYDCECGKRKPVQDLYKIKQHVNRHDVEEHTCPVCAKTFKHHLQMNAHMKVHKREASVGAKLIISDVESDSNSSSTSPSETSSRSVSASTQQQHYLQKQAEMVQVPA